jgi:hypothetical protein
MEEGMMGVGELAVAAVALLASKAVEAVGGEAGERIIKLYDKVKAKLTGSGAEALTDLEKQPQDADSQAALRVQLKKALEADPAFRAELATLVEEIKAKGGDQIIQRVNVTGNQNVTTTIAGSGNVVR